MFHGGALPKGSADGLAPRCRALAARGSGNACTLREYEDAEHGFHYPPESTHFDDVVATTAQFLLDHIAVK